MLLLQVQLLLLHAQVLVALEYLAPAGVTVESVLEDVLLKALMVDEVATGEAPEEDHLGGAALHAAHLGGVQVHLLVGVYVVTDVLGHVGVGRRHIVQQLRRVLLDFPQLLQQLLVDVLLLPLVVDQLLHPQLLLPPLLGTTPLQIVALALPDEGVLDVLALFIADFAQLIAGAQDALVHILGYLVDPAARALELNPYLLGLLLLELLLLELQALDVVVVEDCPTHGAGDAGLGGGLVLGPDPDALQVEIVAALGPAVAEHLVLLHLLLADGAHRLLVQLQSLCAGLPVTELLVLLGLLYF